MISGDPAQHACVKEKFCSAAALGKRCVASYVGTIAVNLVGQREFRTRIRKQKKPLKLLQFT